MKNNRGFSILELIVSFSLTMVIVIVLFEIIVFMKELYEKSVTQTELVNRQNLITDYIYTDIHTDKPQNIYVCGNNCIAFSYSYGQTKQLNWDSSLNTIGYGSYTVALLNNTTFDKTLSLTATNGNQLTGAKICYNNVTSDEEINAYVSIKIPITNGLFPKEDFGINIFYTYDINTMIIDLPISNDC